jgi:AcrR family transcriptional regulator
MKDSEVDPVRKRSRAGAKASRSNTPKGHRASVAGQKQQKVKRRLQPRSIVEREQIMQSAFELFSAVGYDNASTRAIAERAGASHTKVLYHFGSKEQLWIAIMNKAIGDYVEQVQSDVKGASENAGAALHLFIRDFVKFSASFPGVHRIMTMESTQGTSRLDWLIDRHLRDHFDTICGLIRSAQREGTVREGDPARLYYQIIASGAAAFTLSGEYLALTGRDVFAESEVEQTIEFINSVIFIA